MGNKKKKRASAKDSSVKKKATISVAAAVAAAAATGVSTAAINAVQHGAEALASSASDHIINSNPPGGAYLFGPIWRDYANQSQQSAEALAAAVVNLAQGEVNVNLSPVQEHVYTQWVFMDNIEPDQAADLLAGDYSQPIEKSFGRLVDLMAESSIPAHAEAEYENYRSQLDGKSLDAAIRAVHELLGVPVAVAQEPHRPYFSELSIGIEDEQGTDMRLE